MGSHTSRRKVLRIAEKYGLEDIDDRLISMYVDQDRSLREVAHEVNVKITTVALGDEPFAPRHVYETLRGIGDADKREQTDLRRRLRMHGVDVETLEDDWVSHMSIRTYLRKDLDIDTKRKSRELISPEETADHVRRLASREADIIMESLASTEGIDPAEWDIHTEIRLISTETGESERLVEYLERLAEE